MILQKRRSLNSIDNRMPSFLKLGLFCLAILPSCAGYQLGGSKPRFLANVSSVAVPQFKNDTLDARISPLVTSSVVDEFLEDGTLKVKRFEEADSVLEATVSELKYRQLRGEEFDTLRPLELELSLIVSWKLLANTPQRKVLTTGQAFGRTSFFSEANQATGRTNANSEASRDAARQIVSRIVDGF